ncbi:MAG: type II secretion system major pseudopilin GspG [Planctomycetes bacterium]|nr:type II secretion system major pseudopilin GspG [Planctomycetota bacterium]MBU1518159.1 type II secretion system major pseudopilin GspG [Planctomycetota bacterium]MBU2457104.1 type II secretion system major pseudopilin GspG [Planctomycetota bacterium]MBU2597439.1 type II secretion system major pseudopilin GspG [Planctomycetota bacterium]
MTKKNAKRKGFTLVEIMAVIIIIGLLAAIGAMNFLGQTDKARVITTKANLKMLHNAVAQFKMDTGRYPNEEEGLNVLIEAPSDVKGYQSGGYLDSTDIPTDAWGNEFVYIAYPESGKPYVVVSYGADGQEGGEDYDADLHSTDAG